jgi:hypothetical protein
MQKIKLDDLKEGMVVGADVKNMDDMLLLPAGCTLSERYINLLQTWGIPEIQIEQSEETEVSKDPIQLLPPDVAARLTEETRKRFLKFDDQNPIMRDILTVVLRRSARQLLKK